MEHLLQDLKYGVRTFLRQPAFALTAVLALAIGIGANTAVFSVVYAVLLKPLPYPAPEQLVFVHDTYPAVFSASVSFPKYVALKQGNRTLGALAGTTPQGLTITGGGDPEQVSGSRVSSEMFNVMGIAPLLGRWPSTEEDVPAANPVIVLGYGLWQRRFGGDAKIVGSSITVDGVSRMVVGVMPQGFTYPGNTQAWIPLAMSVTSGRRDNFMRLIGRLREGVTVEQAQADLSRVSAEFNAQNGLQRDVKVWSLHEATVANNRRLLLILQGIVAFVLLIACANVANLLLARSVTRQRELAIRAAVGAGRGRLVRQLLTESVMLAVLGGVVGILLASWLLRVFVSMAPANFPRVQGIAIDGGVLAFTLGVATLTGLLFGLAPARRGFRTDPNESLRDTGARGATAGGTRGASRMLVVAEIALAFVLVIGAGLMIKSLMRLQNEPTGFETDGLLTFEVNLPAAKYPNTAPRDFFRRFVDDVRSVPGVQAAAAINYVPLTNFGFNGGFQVVGQPPFDPGKAPITEFRCVTPGYFAAMGIPMRRGEEFTPRNNETDRPVIIINEAMATQYFGGKDPIGMRMSVVVDPQGVTREVVGVAADVRSAQLAAPPVPEVYLPHAQAPLNTMGVVIRLGGARPDMVLPSIRQRLSAMDPNLAIVRPRMMDTVVEASTGGTRLTSTLTGMFALLAALLASVGIYSLIAYSVAQRTRELGIRVALGADRQAVLRLIIGEGVMLAGIGIAIGLAGALFLTRTLESMLYEVSRTDPVVLAFAVLGVVIVAVLASVIPALRALRVDPMIALRAD